MLAESIEGLNINPDGVYVDLTFGGGGHSNEILKNLSPQGKLIAFDQDPDSFANLLDDERFTLVKGNFRYLKNFLNYHEVTPVDGILADLGVSSYQFDKADKGFSIRSEGPLDLRMNPETPISAADVINDAPKEELIRIFKTYGEVKNAPFLANQIITSRQAKKINTTTEFIKSIEKAIPKRKENQFLAQVFQALRIEVNQEIEALTEMLEDTPQVLKTGGRLVVIAYHSLEDRPVKNFIRAGNFEGKQEKDFYGNVISPFKSINKKPITASEEELKVNNRARSARLRVAEKL